MTLTPGQIKGYVDQAASAVYWLAALMILVLFVAAVIRLYGVNITALPRIDGMNLLYLAGAAWLLKR